MKNRGVTFKIFIVILISLILFVSFFMLMQSLFFEKFYITEKTNRLEKNVIEFRDTILSDDTSFNELNELLDYLYKFEETNNAQIAFLNSNGVVKLIKGSLSDEDPTKSREIIFKAINNWRQSEKNYFDVLVSNKTITFNFTNSSTNTDSLVVVSPIKLKKLVSDVIFVVSPLQPVDEATSVMRKYYIYVFIAAIILILFLSVLHSKMISKPLLKLNDAASEMANLNFDVKCEVTSNDEIGNLASNLNFLSEKLNGTLSELQDANIQLQDDIEKERLLEKIRKEFVADVSHELKTPISLIEGYAEALKDGIVSEEDMDFYTEVIIDEAKKMNSLVMDMLNLSRLETTGYKLNIQNHNLYEIVYPIYKKYNTNDREHNIYFEFSIPNSTLVKCDEFRIEEVLKNLISNAVKHTPSSKNVYLRVKIHHNKNVLIEVENEGSPICTEDLDLIWNKFYRVDKSRNKASGGTGLGLAITKNILDLHNSDYSVKNTENGVLFYFTLKI